MNSVLVCRTRLVELCGVHWTDDVVVEWVGPTRVCVIRALLTYERAEARIVLRRGPHEKVLAGGLGQSLMYTTRHALESNDLVAVQWRSLGCLKPARSKNTELQVEVDPRA